MSPSLCCKMWRKLVEDVQSHDPRSHQSVFANANGTSSKNSNRKGAAIVSMHKFRCLSKSNDKDCFVWLELDKCVQINKAFEYLPTPSRKSLNSSRIMLRFEFATFEMSKTKCGKTIAHSSGFGICKDTFGRELSWNGAKIAKCSGTSIWKMYSTRRRL